MAQQQEMTLYDFTRQSELDEWQVIDDTVMGGISRSRMESCGQNLVCFTGTVSLENFGGFCSAGARPGTIHDLSGYKGIALSIKGDGKKYKLTLKNDTAFTGFSYQYFFSTEKGAWMEIRAPFKEFRPFSGDNCKQGLLLLTPAALHRSGL